MYVEEEEAEYTIDDLVCWLFSKPAPIIIVTGRQGTGKTDFSLLMAEILLDLSLIHI